MKYFRIMASVVIMLSLVLSLCACSGSDSRDDSSDNVTSSETKEYIEETLNLANNENQEWTYFSNADAWVLSVVSAVAYPEIEDEQGVSVCVPGAYVTGIDTDGDGEADITSSDATGAVKGSLVIDYETQITSTNGQVYTAASAPVILNTGAAGYGSQSNSSASTAYAAEGYINVSCGNRGKQDTATDEDGNTYYTGDAPSCLVDQKAAARYVKYNILLGNIPGSADYFVSTGGSGGGAHAAMFAATSNNSDFYDYQIEAGAAGIYKNDDGTYSTTVTIDGTDYEISDGAWGCIAYSAITSLYESNMALAFEYYLDTDYSFGTDFQAQLAEYLSESYMEYINEQNLSIDESAVGFDLNGDGDTDDTVELTIEYDSENHADTNGYYGTYLDLYMAEFTENLQWYVDSLDYAEGWTWFDEDGNALTDDEVAAMTTSDKAQAFIEGRYAKSSQSDGDRTMDSVGNFITDDTDGGLSDRMDGTDVEMPDEADRTDIELPDGTDGTGLELPDEADRTDIELPDDAEGELPDGRVGGKENGTGRGDKTGGSKADIADGDLPDEFDGEADDMPDAGATQSATVATDSANYSTYEEMVEEYKSDIEEIEEGDKYGNNIVSLYNPLNYIGDENTEDPTWTRIVMGASEGDMSMFTSLNLQIAWLNAGVDAEIEWQWDGSHVPSEVLGDSFALYVDEMYGEYVDGSETVAKPEAEAQTENGTAGEATGTDISSWVSYDGSNVSFSLADIAAYRVSGASKTMPGFDMIDYDQEGYVFGSSEKDARHWDTYLLEIFEEYADVLGPLFNN